MTDQPKLDIGDLVFLRSSGDKNKVRDQYIVQGLLPEVGKALVRKSQAQLQAKKYKVDISDLIPITNFRPGPQLSADMSKNENVATKKESNEKIEKEKVDDSEKKKKSMQKKKPAGSIGAPNLIRSNRPMRQAAAKAMRDRPWLNKVTIDQSIKHPWLQEDQPSEDEDEYIIRPRHQPMIQQADPGVQDELAVFEQSGLYNLALMAELEGLAQAQFMPIHARHELSFIPEDWDQLSLPDSVSASSEDTDLVTPDTTGELPPDQVGGDSDQVEDDHVHDVDQEDQGGTTDSSEYMDLSINRTRRDSNDLAWDNFDESPTFVAPPQIGQQQAAALPPGWPPRHLSSECTNQMEVTVLTGNPDRYFEGPVFSSPESIIRSPNREIIELASLNTQQPINMSQLQHINRDNLQENTVQLQPRPSQHQPELEAAEIVTEIQRSTGAIPRPRSARIQSRDRVDYRVLNTRGRHHRH